MTHKSILFLKLITNRLTEEEAKELHQWIEANPRHRSLIEMVSDPDELTREYRFRKMIDSSRAEADMKRRIAKAEAPQRYIRYTVAASIVALLGFGVWSLLQDTFFDNNLDRTAAIAVVKHPDVIRPGEMKALVRSVEGDSIALGQADSVAVKLFVSDNAKVAGSSTAVVQPVKEKNLILDVPRGGEFKIILEDSTEVWLNSESSLHYPDKFDSKERVVEVSGEAYFSVQKDSLRPFYVIAGEQKIRVYGTTFNVRNYGDDSLAYTTLETGSIAISRLDGQGGEVFIKPDHQAIFNKTESHLVMQQVDAKRISAWRYGRFVFDGQTLLNIMRDLSRWYNFEYEFLDPSIKEIRFFGSIPRYAEFVTAITILENCGDIRFDVAGTKVIISKLSK